MYNHIKKISMVFASSMVLAIGMNVTASAEVDFSGKRIEVLISANPGGGTDTTGRLLGEFIAKYLPGEPGVVYRNRPGASGVTAMNHFARQVQPDGFTIVASSSSVAAPANWRGPQSQYNPIEMPMIGGAERGSTVLVINKEALPRLTDHSQDPVIMGALDGNRSGMQMMLWGIEFLDWNARWVIGYPGTSDIVLALQRGEIDVTSTANSFLIEELIQTGNFTLLTQSGIPSDEGLLPREEFPDVPILAELVRPHFAEDRHRLAFEYWEGINTLDKFAALPPGTPDEIVRVYREAWSKAVRDPVFMERGRVIISEDFNPIPGEAQARLVRQVADIQPEALDFIEEMRIRQGLPAN